MRKLEKGRPGSGVARGRPRVPRGDLTNASQRSKVAIQGGMGREEHSFLNANHFFCVCLWGYCFSLVAVGAARAGASGQGR